MYDSTPCQSISSLFLSLKKPIKDLFYKQSFLVEGTVVRITPWNNNQFLTLAEVSNRQSFNLTVLVYENILELYGEVDENDQVLVRGQISLTKQGGILIIAESLETIGVGNMPAQLNKWRQEYEYLLTRAKKALPPVCVRIALVSSESIQGYQDFWTALKVGNYDLYSTKMQGTTVAEHIAAQIEEINERGGYDCIVIVRGGGSPNDLFGYNHPTLLMAIAESKIPVITGIGHEGDYLLCEEVADVRCSTPTAAAELLNKMAAEREREIQVSKYKRWVIILAVILFVIFVLKIIGK